MTQNIDVSQLPSYVLDNITAIPPPLGQVSNFVNPPYRGDQSKIAMYVMLPLMSIGLIVRLYTRVHVTRKFGADDYLAIVSTICVGAYCGILLYMLKAQMGFHVWDVPLSRLDEPFQKSNLASQCLYNLSTLFVKTTLLVLYLRIFRPSSHTCAMIWVGIVFQVLFYTACSIAQIKLYLPRHGNWMTTRPPSVIKALLDVTAVQGVVNIATDFYILFIPMHLVIRLQLPLGRKIGVCGIFLSDLIACICSIIATVYRFRARPSLDTTWVTVPMYTLGLEGFLGPLDWSTKANRRSIVELTAGVLCSCMPVVLAGLKHITKQDSSQRVLRYLKIRRSNGSTEENKPQTKPKYNILNCPIPKPTLTGLRSFIQKSQKSQPHLLTDVVSYDELGTVNDDYHMHIRTAS